MFKITIISILLWLLVSLVTSLGFLLISPTVFGVTFFIVMGLVGFIGYPVNRYLDNKDMLVKIQAKVLTDQELLIQTSQTAVIECAYCSSMNNTTLNINNDYTFKCRKCSQKNKVVINTTCCRTTDLEAEPDE